MTPITITGNLAADPELRHFGQGGCVANFTVVVNRREFVKAAGEWRNLEPSYFDCQAWNSNSGPLAENVAASLTKGAEVIVTGDMRQRKYTAKDGHERRTWELRVDSIGPSLRRNAYRRADTAPSTGGNPFGHSAPIEPPDDPWAMEAGR